MKLEYVKPDLEEITLILEGPFLLKTSHGGEQSDKENNDDDMWA